MPRFVCFYLILSILLIQGCVVEDSRDKVNHNKAQMHAMKINAVNEQIVDILNDVFYLDYCISDYSSSVLNHELVSIYFPETEITIRENLISIDRHRGVKVTVHTNGSSIKENKSQWEIEALISKLWGDYHEEEFQFSVCNTSDTFSMEGRVITNQLYEKGFYYGDLKLTFTTDIVPIHFTDLSRPELYIERSVPLYIFMGEITCFFGDNGRQYETEPAYEIEVQSLKGYDHKEYIGSDPVYDGTTYFRSGRIGCIIHQVGQSDNKLIITVKNEQNWELEYNGKAESFHPN